MEKSRVEGLANYERKLRGAERERRHYVSLVRVFLQSTDKVGREGWLEYERKLKKGGYADGTVRKIFGAVGRFHRVNNLEWDFGRGEAPQIRESDVSAPALHPDVIADMIAVAKVGGLTAREAAFLALSTTYGVRQVEMKEAERDDIDLINNLVLIHTRKRGRERWHVLPEEIKPYLMAYSFDEYLSDFILYETYLRIERKAGVRHYAGVGFHSIRRTLDTILVDKLGLGPVREFLRWKRGSGDMAQRYYATRFVGREGEEVSMSGTGQNLDQKVFAVHPFLPVWR